MIADVTAKGLEAQLKAELRANELGYIVSKPTTECCRYDMIIDNGSELKRVQVKYAGSKQTSSTGSCVVDFRKRSANGKERKSYSKDEVDAVLVYLPELDKICYFPVEFIKDKGRLTIRYNQSKNNQTVGVIFAEDYYW